MAKIALCDICLTRHNKLTRAARQITIKGRRDLKIEMCLVHTFEVNKKYAKVDAAYVQFVYKMVYHKELSLLEAEHVLRKRR